MLDPEWLTAVCEGVDAAVAADRGLPADLRQQYDKRLEALDRKESYLLDLASEEGWPKNKLRERIDAIRQEAADLRHSIQRADQRLDVGQQVLHDALALLATPQAAYVHGNELVKTALNKAFFTKLYVDGHTIAGHEMHEPFDKLIGAYEEYVIAQTSALVDGLAAESAGILTDSDAHDLDPAASSNALTWQVSGWSKVSMVDDTGIEPVTPSVSETTGCDSEVAVSLHETLTCR